MPDRWLDEFMTLVDRVDAKLADIRRGLGSQLPGDRAEDRHLAFLRALAEGVAPTAAAAAASAHPGARHPPGSLAALFEHPALRATPADPPTGTVPVSFVPSGPDPAPVGRALLALDSPGGPRFVRWDGRSVTDIDPSAVAPLLLAAIQAPVTLPALTPAVRASLDHAVRALTAAQVADPATAPTRAMRRVLRLAASGDDPASIAPLADRLLSRLSRGLRAGDLLAVRDWCARAVPPASAGRARLLQDLETTLARTAPAPDAPAPRVLAAFLPQPVRRGG
jgi:hypothetical protein